MQCGKDIKIKGMGTFNSANFKQQHAPPQVLFLISWSNWFRGWYLYQHCITLPILFMIHSWFTPSFSTSENTQPVTNMAKWHCSRQWQGSSPQRSSWDIYDTSMTWQIFWAPRWLEANPLNTYELPWDPCMDGYALICVDIREKSIHKIKKSTSQISVEWFNVILPID